MSTSSGTGGIKAWQIRAVPEEVLLRIINLVLFFGAVPSRLHSNHNGSNTIQMVAYNLVENNFEVR